MKNLIKTLLVIGIVVAAGVVTGSAHAYYYQPSYQSYGYNSYNYGSSYAGYSQTYYQPTQAVSYPVYNSYARPQNTVGGLIQDTLNLTASFTYVAPPIHQYFYQYYPSYNYGGYGYGYNY